MRREYPDGPKLNFLLVIIGQMLPARFPFDPLAFGLGIAQRYGDIAYFRLGPLRVYQLNHPELARQVLVEQPDKFHKPRLLKQAFRPYAREGLLTSDGALWKRQRRLMQPAFHQRHLAVYGEVMVNQALAMVEAFQDGQVRDIGAEMTKLTLQVVVKSLFGSELPPGADEIGGSMIDVLDSASTRMNTLLKAPLWIPTRRNIRERRAIAKLNAILHLLIEARRGASKEGDDLLSLLLGAVDDDGGDKISERQMRDEMMTLFMAGHETSASTLTWAWYLLSRHPEVEAKLLAELNSVLGGRAPSFADLPNLPYTEMVVREVIRLYPPASGVARQPIEDVTIGEYTVGKGSLVTINIYAVHHDERFFADTERFDPERFAQGWEERVPRSAYLPFGAGPRVCIGNAFAMMEARLILATVIQRYKLSLEPDIEIPPVQKVTLRPSGPVRMKLSRREPAAPLARTDGLATIPTQQNGPSPHPPHQEMRQSRR